MMATQLAAQMVGSFGMAGSLISFDAVFARPDRRGEPRREGARGTGPGLPDHELFGGETAEGDRDTGLDSWVLVRVNRSSSSPWA